MFYRTKKLPVVLIISMIFVTACLVFTACQTPSESADEEMAAGSLPVFNMVLRVIKEKEGSITHIDIGSEMSAVKRTPENPFTLKAPVRYTVVSGIADRLENIHVQDDEGRVELRQLEDESDAGGMIIWRKWQALRPIKGPIKISYRARMPEPGPHVPGPPYNLSLNGGGVSGAGCGFLALPEDSGDFKLRITWNLEDLGPDAAGITSLGEGNFETTGPIDRLFQSYYLAGPLGRYPKQGSSNGFSSAWLGEPPFNVQEVMIWSEKAYAALKSFFHDTDPAPYRFFMRVGPADAGGGGTALYNSFMLYVPMEPELARDPRETVFHEMAHKWVGGIEGPSDQTFWFSEGLTVHYTRTLMYRAKLGSAEKFLKDVNSTVANYLTNPLKNMPNEEIGKKFWEDRNALRLPYQRGSLYFAYVDGKIRETSKGERSLDDLVFFLFDRRKKGEPLTIKIWIEELKKEVGSSAETDFHSIIIRGEDCLPDSSAFGSEFERVATKLRPFELGFDERKSLYTSEKRITGLMSGSAAERAGLQNGDQILNSLDINALRYDKNRKIKLKVRRGDMIRDIEYLPRGQSVDGFKWVQISERNHSNGF